GIIFGFDESKLQALLINWGFEPGIAKWFLMGGLLGGTASAEQSADRVLHLLTGIANIYVIQQGCVSDLERDTVGRVLSIALRPLINKKDYSTQMQLEHEARWFPLNEVPQLIFDHNKMVERARKRLQEKVVNHPIGFELLPTKFTLPQLQSL